MMKQWEFFVFLSIALGPINPAQSILFVNYFRKWFREYNIDIHFVDVPKTDQETIFQRSQAKWKSVIRRDVRRFNTNGNPTGPCGEMLPFLIDDLYVCAAYVSTLDGPGGIVGSASLDTLRDDDDGRFPAVGEMKFDLADVDNLRRQGVLEAVIVHEMGHLLGIGSAWVGFGLQPNEYTDTGCPYKFDSYATRAYHLISGCTNQPIPMELDFGSGTNCKHWDEFCFRGEIMTGRVSNTSVADLKLSAMTIGSLEDMGYKVNYDKADLYTAADMDPSCVCKSSSSNINNDSELQQQPPSPAASTNTSNATNTGDEEEDKGRVAAVAYGQQVLHDRRASNQHRHAAKGTSRLGRGGGGQYVGDQTIVVFYLEQGELRTVHVTADDGVP